MRSLRLATFNTLHGLVAGSITSLDVDVLALQEVDVRVARSGFRDQAADAAAATGMSVFFGSATRLGVIGRYGNALLVRGEIEDAQVVALRGSREPRCAVLAGALVDGISISVAVTHLSHVRDEALRQLPAVVEALYARPAPRVLLGDLNAGPEDVGPVLEAAGLTVADPTMATFPPRRARIDHVAVDGLRITKVEVPERPASDHLAVVVTAEPL